MVFAAATPTFAHDVAPILYQQCAPCHHTGGEAPFPLITYADAVKRARMIREVTQSRFMPPWLPEHGYGNFAGELRLSDAELRTLAAWAAGGTPEGDASKTPAPPSFTGGWQMGKPDLVLDAGASYTTPATGPDVYWNFVFRPNLTARRWVRAVEIRPGQRNLVHHANLLVDHIPSPRANPEAGFPGMDLDVRQSPFDLNGQMLFWKPGSTVREEPEGFAWRIDPGTELILNSHMRPTGKPEEVRPQIGLYFTDKPQTKYPLVFQLENDDALRIPANARDFTIGDDFRVPLDLDLLGIYPHAHDLGKRIEAWATLPDHTRRWLIRIPEWDPGWQAVYYFREPLFLPKGSVISVRWHYDNTASNPRNPNNPPKPVEAGNQSTDEMAHFWIQALPRGGGDRRRELNAAVLEHVLERNPKDFTANMNLGAEKLSRLDAQGAVTSLAAAVEADPKRNDARGLLGLALATTGRVTEAIREYDIVLESDPGDLRTRFNRANALMRAGRVDDAIRDYRAVLAALPDNAQAKQRLEEALAAAAKREIQ